MLKIAKKYSLHISLVFFLLSLLQILFNMTAVLGQRELIDFSVYYGATKVFMEGQNVYAQLYGGVPFNYPPSILPFLVPFTLLPLRISQILFTIISFSSLAVSFYYLKKVLHTIQIEIARPFFFILLAFAYQTFPVKFTLVLGQINLIVLALTIASIYYYLASEKYDKNYYLSLILFSIASCLKVFPLYLLTLFFIRKDYRFFILSLVMFGLGNIIGGTTNLMFFMTNVYPSLTNLLSYPNFYDQSLFALGMRLQIPALIAKPITSVLALFIQLAILLHYKRNFHDEKVKNLNYIFVICAFLILALSSISGPFSWQHHLVFAYPLIFLFAIQYKNNIVALLVTWLFLTLHFRNDHLASLFPPILLSYQTFLILFIVIKCIHDTNKKIIKD
ncbi:MAG: glycosyltransferase family 87 protein [bacterium]|nr:glycosyltransferase family 87 protein [bacterium]